MRNCYGEQIILEKGIHHVKHKHCKGTEMTKISRATKTPFGDIQDANKYNNLTCSLKS